MSKSTSQQPRAKGLPLLAAGLCLLLGSAASAHAANQPPRYRYGEAWWQEYESDKDTRLLLHFGPPTPSAHKTLTAAVQRDKAEETTIAGGLRDLDADPRTSARTELPGEALSLNTLPPVDEKNAAPGVVLDYSDTRRTLKPGAGTASGAGGRFGNGLACDGTGALTCRAGPVVAIEGWFKVDSLPTQEVCLFSVAKDESRLLLRPDGRLELRLKKPRGIPNEKHLTPEAIQLLLQQQADIVSPEPVVPSEWFHVVVYSKSHPTPGGGEPWDARLKVNGSDVAWHLSERFNSYSFLGSGEVEITLGNSAAGGQGFKGLMDEIRISSAERGYYEVPALPWRDAKLERPLQFNRPFFRNDSTVFHASLDSGLKLDLDTTGAGEIQVPVGAQKLDGICVQGIRGKAWVMDPEIGFARVPLKGLNALDGALEFWLRPVNWDDMTGYWHHTPPLQRNLTVARLYGKDKRDGALKPFLSVLLPRAYNLERQRVPVDPGHWLHLAAVWDRKDLAHARLYINGQPSGQAWRASAADLQNLEPAYVEFGVTEKVWAARREAPRIEIDEIAGYRLPLRDDEVAQARQRWMGKLEPIKLYDDQFTFKWSLQKLEFSLVPLLPEGQSAASCAVALHGPAPNSKVVAGPVESKAFDGDRFRMLLSDGKELPYGKYQFRFEAKDAAGQAVISGTRDWNYEEEPWRHCRAGIADKVPPPWTPIKFQGDTLETRMTRYVLGADGLPKEIHADGVNILAAPIQFLEDGKPMPGELTVRPAAKEIEASWAGTFTGRTCDILMRCTAEYDGMIRYELNLKPKGKLARLSFVVPIKAENATRYLCYPAGARGVSTGVIAAQDGVALASRTDPAPYKVWQAYQEERKKNAKLTWEQYWAPRRETIAAYGFYPHVDINDRNRGLWWFCDNAAGWWQSKTVSAIEIVRSGATVSLAANLIAEPVEYQPGKPAVPVSERIVFAILPHPARPLPEKYRLFNRVAPERDARACDIYDAFFPWPMNPKAGEMCLYPAAPVSAWAADPAKPQTGPSWDYAQSCVPLMKASKAKGCRTLYLSKAWFSCRAGAYDNWEWRSGEGSACALTPSFVNYLCWEMDEWLRRDIWDAIYLDECYEHPAQNVEAGMAVRLPDGSMQPGVTNFQFRELMKRWRNLFHAHGKEPVLIAHLTYSFQYPGVVFCDSYLDGENRPIVSLRSSDWIDSTAPAQFEVLQNGRLWGVSSFYMPFISEGGFEDKSRSQYPRWQWRMARQAQSQFAHYETATVYEGQGAQVYKQYWKELLDWGAGSPTVTFHPYWDNAAFLECEDQGSTALVSVYRQPGKVLLIASNRGKQDRTLKVKLNLKALGLRERPTTKSLDGTFSPPAGADFSPGEYSAKVREKLLGDSTTKTKELLAGEKPHDALDDLNKEDLALEDPAAAKARKAGEWEPRLNGDVLLLPVRSRDYRVVVLE